MKFHAAKAIPRACLFAALWIGAGRLFADPSTFHLFPSTAPSHPLLLRSFEDDDPPLFEGVTLIAPSMPLGGHGPGFWLPDRAFLASRSQTPSLPVVARPRTLAPPLKPWATALVMATTIGYQIGNSFKETSVGGFHFTDEGFFGQNTYTGGVDKVAHFVDYTLAQRALHYTYRRIGYSDRQSGWLSFGTAMAAGIVNEIGDGTTIFGFSWEDLLMDAFGAGTATALSRTGWDDTLGFRFGAVNQQETPPCCLDFSNIGRDYSGEIYTADVKIAGLARRLRLNPGPARFLLFSLTYGSNGYNTASPEIRQRLVGFEVGIHFSEILRALGVPTEPVWGEVLYYFFDTLRIPYTAVGFRYDLNHNEWFGPTAGRTPFQVPAGSR